MLRIATLIVIASLAGCASLTSSGSGTSAHPDITGPLFEAIAALDAATFDAFNRCSEAGELERHGSYFAPGVEFYHDTGGATFTRDEMLANTGRNVCGHFRRELVVGSLRVYPIKDFGAIEQGVHRFCQFDTGKCDGTADFVIVWSNVSGAWQITRVLSYAHRPS